MSLVRKILEATIPSGGSSATFTDSDIPNSLIRVYSTNSNIYPQNISLAGNTLTVTYEQVTSALGVAVEMVKQGLEIDDNLTSDASDHALSAKQGKALKGLIDSIPAGITELSDLDDVAITDIEDGQVLAWDDVLQKFVNVNQSGGGSSNIYSTTETVVGEYNGKPLYRKIITGTFSSNETLVSSQIYSASITISIPNIDKMFADPGRSYYTVGTAVRGFIGFVIVDNTNLELITRFDRQNATYYIVLEYTKTTD